MQCKKRLYSIDDALKGERTSLSTNCDHHFLPFSTVVVFFPPSVDCEMIFDVFDDHQLTYSYNKANQGHNACPVSHRNSAAFQCIFVAMAILYANYSDNKRKMESGEELMNTKKKQHENEIANE